MSNQRIYSWWEELTSTFEDFEEDFDENLCYTSQTPEDLKRPHSAQKKNNDFRIWTEKYVYFPIYSRSDEVTIGRVHRSGLTYLLEESTPEIRGERSKP